MWGMTRRYWFCLVAVILLANAGATCVMSGTTQEPDVQKAEGPWHGIVQSAMFLLRWPIRTADSADIRDITLLVGFGLASLLVGLAIKATGSGTPRLQSSPPGTPTGGWRPWRRWLPSCEAWLWFTAVGVLVQALISLAANGSAVLSWGWTVRFVAGIGWAILLCRTIEARRVRHVMFGLLGVASVAMLLSLAHRADRGYAHLSWPIGPITITGALAAAWTAMAAALAIGRAPGRWVWPQRIFAAAVCVLAAYVLQQTGRRAPAVGLVFAVLVTGLLLARTVLKRRTANLLTAAVFALAVAGAVFYTVKQAGSAKVEVAGPVNVRFELWRLSSKLIREAPVLGHGPDLFVSKMTNLMAPLRAYSPHVYHGNINPHAHNEWLQAAVELGIPGALLYLALPLGVIVHGIRRLDQGRRAQEASRCSASGEDRAVMLSLIAGLAAIVVLDSASITLRGPIMPIWYWTLLGLLASSSRTPTGDGNLPEPADGDGGRARKERDGGHRDDGANEDPSATRRSASRAILIGVGVVSLGVAVVDLEHSRAACERVVHADRTDLVRLWADETLAAWRENALLALETAIKQPRPENLAVAEPLCKDMYDWWRGVPESPAIYADILLRRGKRQEAVKVLEETLGPQGDPFNRVVNLLYAERITSDPVEKLNCVRRAVHSWAFDDVLRAIALAAMQSPAAQQAVAQELPWVRRIASAAPDEAARDATVELLRINAVAQEQAGNLPEAIGDQRLAAEFYRRLEQANHSYRRRADVEAETFQTLAQMLYSADHADYQAAYEAIVAAERYAVLGIKHETLADPRPEDGFVGGEVVPTEYPESLQPMWRLSVLLHILVGREQQLMPRVLAGMPRREWNDAAVRRELARVYGRAATDMTALPAAQRPKHYPYILEMAGQLQPAGGR